MNVLPAGQAGHETHVQVEAGALSSGVYSYSLYVDGSLIDTLQLIVAK